MLIDCTASEHPWTAAEYEARDRGREARRRGAPRMTNPYRYADGTVRCGAWDFGWCQEDEAQRARREGRP